ncbi:hypothetical protein [Actinomadura sp. 9N407]|uniref:hypothetical protein n=1 Tax=Actinomadura sp. 9N407 TaxID=3375154 RepID=UPI0037B16BD4
MNLAPILSATKPHNLEWRPTMPLTSPEAQKILGPAFLTSLRAADLDASQRAVIDEGWIRDDGAILLAAYRDSYFGNRSAFTDIGDYEWAANGRGVPDLGLETQGPERVHTLMRRGCAFAWAALHAVRASMPESQVMARISAAPVLMDPDTFTGYVGFVTCRSDDATGPSSTDGQSGIQIVLWSHECAKPLPD